MNKINIPISNVINLLIIFIVLIPNTVTLFTFEAPHRGWYQLNSKSSDYEALTWINDNISPEDLIITDYTFPSLFIQSFSN